MDAGDMSQNGEKGVLEIFLQKSNGLRGKISNSGWVVLPERT